MKTNEKKSVALLKFFGCRASRIKNSFKKPSKKLFGKLGLFLIFGAMFLNLSASFGVHDNRDEYIAKNISLGVNRASAEWDLASILGSGMLNTPEGAAFDDSSSFNQTLVAANDGTGDGKNIFIDWILVAVLNAMSALLDFSGKLLDMMLKQEFFDALIKQNSSIYKGWTIVRDTLNIFFMILLLFSAFATIFQVEKYHIRKVIIMLIVMALLVNFSFPIAGFIIDFSNSAMYYLIELTAPGSGATQSGVMMRFSSFGSVLKNVNEPNSLATTDLILSIIFHFIIFITFISIALNLLIRNLAFAILLILSPAGFAFAFFPDTKGVANSWWSALFKYAFLGPIMVFFLYIAVLIFDQGGAMSDSANFSGSAVAFIVPIVFLWMGLIISNKFGGDGAGVAMNMAKRTGGWVKGAAAGTAIGGAVLVGRSADSMTGGHVKGNIMAIKNRWNQFGEDYNAKANKIAAERGAKIGVKGANEKLVQENRKKWKENGGLGDDEATRIESDGTRAEKMALYLERAEEKGFDSNPDKAFTQYKAGLDALKDNKVYKDIFERNVTKKNIDLEIRANVEGEMAKLGRSLTTNETSVIAEKSFKKLDSGNWKDQNIERTLAFNKMLGNGGVAEGGKKIINGYSDSAKNKLSSDMKGDKYAAGKGQLWV